LKKKLLEQKQGKNFSIILYFFTHPRLFTAKFNLFFQSRSSPTFLIIFYRTSRKFSGGLNTKRTAQVIQGGQKW